MARTSGSRNAGAAMRLLVLGLLKRFGPNHGHAMRQYISNAFIDRWADVQPGSLYYALDQLSKEGLIVADRTERVGQRPTRTVYRITPDGDASLQELLTTLTTTIKPFHDTFNLALLFSGELPDETLIELIQGRAKQLREDITKLQRGSSYSLSKGLISPRGAEIFHHIESRLEADIVWHDEFLAKLQRGEAQPFREALPGGHPLFEPGQATIRAADIPSASKKGT